MNEFKITMKDGGEVVEFRYNAISLTRWTLDNLTISTLTRTNPKDGSTEVWGINLTDHDVLERLTELTGVLFTCYSPIAVSKPKNFTLELKNVCYSVAFDNQFGAIASCYSGTRLFYTARLEIAEIVSYILTSMDIKAEPKKSKIRIMEANKLPIGAVVLYGDKSFRLGSGHKQLEEITYALQTERTRLQLESNYLRNWFNGSVGILPEEKKKYDELSTNNFKQSHLLDYLLSVMSVYKENN